ncbi:MAG: hypothetical protein HZA49_02485 [Planctomycetes bacterium]|nr:hypothetical protein [Planctomycetota bacterium]
MSRDDFDKSTKEILAKRVGYKCSNPKCAKLTSGPQESVDKALNIGVASHITAASPGGKRYNASLTEEQRKSIENGIWLCQNCGKLVDNDEKRYPCDLLLQWKKSTEEVALKEVEGSACKLDQEENLISFSELRIENILDKDGEKKAKFFRSAGPKWIDFEQGFVAKRAEEVDKILQQLESKRIVFIKGQPACGKSVVLKWVGYELAKAGKNVSLIELRMKTEVIPPSELKKLYNNEPAYFLIDDAHFNLSYVSDIIRTIETHKILIALRSIKGQAEGQRFGEIDERLGEGIELKPESVADNIIELFLSQHGQKTTPETKALLKQYRNNLWILGWTLGTLQDENFKSVDKDKVLQKVVKWMQKELINDHPKYKNQLINAPDVLLPLCVFNRYEIPVNKELLTRILEIKNDDIDALVSINEVVATTEKNGVMLSLHHSALADLYFQAIKQYDSLGKEVKKKIREKIGNGDWFGGLFHTYIQSHPLASGGIIRGLDRWANDSREKEFHRSLINEIVKSNSNHESIVYGIQCEPDINQITWFVGRIFPASDEVAEKMIPAIASKIESESDINKISSCFSVSFNINQRIAKKLIGKLDAKRLKEKIEYEPDIEKIGWYICNISKANKKVASTLIPVIALKIGTERDANNVFSCLKGIVDANKELAKKLIKELDMGNLKVKMESEPDIEKIGWFISIIMRISLGDARKLIDSDNLKAKIKAEIDIEKIARCVNQINDVRAGIAKELMKGLEVSNLRDKIESEADIAKISLCINAWADKEIIKELIEELDTNNLKVKIGAEADIGKIGWLISIIVDTSQDVAKKLIDFNGLKTKIQAEPDIEKIGMCISSIYKASHETANELIPLVVGKIHAEHNINKIGCCVMHFDEANKLSYLYKHGFFCIHQLKTFLPFVPISTDGAFWRSGKKFAKNLVGMLVPENAITTETRDEIKRLKNRYGVG